MEIQLDPRGIRVKTTSGWKSFAPTDSVEQIIAALVEDRQGKAHLPTDGLGVMRLAPQTTDVRPTGPQRDHKEGTATGKWRKVPHDPRLRRVLASAKPKRQAVGMTLDELLA